MKLLFLKGLLICSNIHHIVSSKVSIEDMILNYEDDKNAMIAVTETEDINLNDDKDYDDVDNRIRLAQSMNMIFLGPATSFLRIDAESILHMLPHIKKHLIPISRTLLIWDILTDVRYSSATDLIHIQSVNKLDTFTKEMLRVHYNIHNHLTPIFQRCKFFLLDGRGAGYLQGREFLALGMLLNVVPEEDLYHVNFGNPSVLRHFANTFCQLKSRKFGILALAYKRYFGEHWYDNSSNINELGYLICGFPTSEMKKISPSIFKELSQDILTKVGKCDYEQTSVLYEIATQKEAYGQPFKWSSHEIRKLCSLFECIPERDISSIQLEAIAALSPEVMTTISQSKLEYFTKQQILRMSHRTRKMYIVRMQLRDSIDMNDVQKYSATSNRHVISFFLLILTFTLNIVILA